MDENKAELVSTLRSPDSVKRIEIKDFDSVGDNLKDKHNKLMQEE